MLKKIFWLSLAGFVVILDQVTKYFISKHIALYETFPVFPGFSLTLRHNRGAAFNLFAEGSGWQRWFFVGLAVVVISVIFVWLGRLSKKEKQEAFGLSLILGGALGNLIDRILQGYVIDFILLHYKHFEYPAFNIADSAICIGAFVLMIHLLFRSN